ncbi:MAG: TonB-dependent receptor, partial [Beijerinckiaceae bacterium]|nr:TonB-dependent receptor [Beijerinckiaceae bacterium]
MESACIPLTSISVYAAESLANYNIPAGDLGEVLSEIASTGGRPIAFPAALTNGRRAGPIVGKMTVLAAVAKALAGTGLTVVGGSSGPLTVRAVSGGAAATSGAALDIADIDVAGNASQSHDNGFQAGDAGATTRLADAPAREVPLAVSSVTSSVIQSQSLTSATDAIQNVAGVTLAPNAQGVPSYTIRGFVAGAPYINGDQGAALATVPIDDIDRVEVLKGPTSILTGQTDDGGAVNISTKKPTDQTIRDLTVRYGSFGYKTLAFDLGGIVPDTEGFTYRLNTSGNLADHSYGGDKRPHEYLISPSLQWKDQDTSVLVGARYYDTKLGQPPLSFIPTTGGNPPGDLVRVPRGASQGNDAVGVKTQSADFYSDQSHDFGRFLGFDVTLNNHVQYSIQNGAAPFFDWEGDQFGNQADALIVYEKYAKTGLALRPNLTLKYDAGFLQQTTKIGFDYSDDRNSEDSLYGGSSIINIDGSGSPLPIPTATTAVETAKLSATDIDSGYYLVDKVDTFNGRLHILGSVREDHFSEKNIDGFALPGFSTSTVTKGGQDGFSWVGGGAFDVTPWFTIYGNRNNGFSAQIGVNEATGAPLSPQQRDQSEVGGRFYLFDKKLTLTTSFYKLMQTNVSVADPTDPTGLRQILVAGEASRGFEFEAQGEITRGWNAIASFSAIHAAYTDPNYTSIIPAVPQYAASLWSTYTLQQGVFAGFTFGFGAHGNVSSFVEGYDSSFHSVGYKVPGYVVEDAMIGYSHNNYSLTLKMNNLTNEYFYSPARNAQVVVVGEGRNFMLTGKYSF